MNLVDCKPEGPDMGRYFAVRAAVLLLATFNAVIWSGGVAIAITMPVGLA